MGTMTIREHYIRVYRRITYSTIAATMVFIVFFNSRYPHLNFVQEIEFGFILALPLSAVLLLLFRGRFICPRCHTDLAKWSRKSRRKWFVWDSRMFYDRWEACPNCGVGFNEPWTNP